METDAGVMDYDSIRNSNIARNEVFLKKLGLNGSEHNRSIGIPASRTKTKSIVVQAPTRSSHRIATITSNKGTPNYIEDSIRNLRAKKTITDDICDGGEDEELGSTEEGTLMPVKKKVKNIPAPTTASTPQVMSSDSCKLLSADVRTMTKDLGNPVSSFGKAAVMALANGGVLPKFNKMSGTTEWANCVFLWVNIDNSSLYNNQFHCRDKDGEPQQCTMVWYGGARMHSESPVTKRILNAKSQDSVHGDEKAEKTSENVYVFARFEQENYFCLGRVTAVSCNLQAAPIKMTLQLLDYHQLQKAKHFMSIFR